MITNPVNYKALLAENSYFRGALSLNDIGNKAMFDMKDIVSVYHMVCHEVHNASFIGSA